MLERVAGEQGDDLVGSGKAGVGTSIGREPRDILAEKSDFTRVRPHVAADLVEQRGLARAVRPDNEAAFARPYRKGYILGDRKAAEGLLEIDHLECVIGYHRGLPRKAATSLLRPGTMPVGMTRTMNRNTRPNSMFQRSI